MVVRQRIRRLVGAPITLAFALHCAWLTTAQPLRAGIDLGRPFHPDQCLLAEGWAEARRRAAPDDPRGHRVWLEAQLCRGLDDDDARALDTAVAGFAPIVAAQPSDFFAHFYRAQALRRRFPLWDETAAAFSRALAAADQADLGAARDELHRLTTQQLDEVQQLLDLHRREVDTQRALLRGGDLRGVAFGEALLLIAQCGPEDLATARRLLDARLALAAEPLLASYYRAELWRGVLPSDKLVRLYRSAMSRLCDRPDAEDRRRCDVARWRAEGMRRTEADIPAAKGGRS